MIPNEYTSPFCVPCTGGLLSRSSSGAVHNRPGKQDHTPVHFHSWIDVMEAHTYFSNGHNCRSIPSLRRCSIFANYTIQSRQFSARIVSQRHNSTTSNCRESVCQSNANSACPATENETKRVWKRVAHIAPTVAILLTRTISCISDILNIQSSLICSFSRISWSDPFGQYSVSMQQFGGSTLAP